ncbi:hypothetical protein ACIGB8_17730 [Promicromonospora sukumoe]|uniref:hypothetical protein n=1 Tax=Promicromonospora sukumoe TaxID=88382 RepID=UPI0037C802B3
MTTTTFSTTPEASTVQDRPLFTTSEGLRILLLRLHMDGPRAWSTDPHATELIEFCMTKYAGIAKKYRQTPHDAAFAAFEVLRAPATAEADDPWGVVTRAVQLSLMAEDRANGLLCDQSRARRLLTSDQHDATRFSDYELDGARSVETITREAIAVDPALLDHLDATESLVASRPSQVAAVEARIALDLAAKVLAGFGWKASDARACLDYIAERLTITGDTARAFEYLRRDKIALGRFDLELRRWTALCAVVLGQPHHPALAVRDGLLARVMRGQRMAELVVDERLVRAVAAASPARPALRVVCDA